MITPEKGYREAREHTLDHLKIVPQHYYVVEDNDKQIVAAMVLHHQDKVFLPVRFPNILTAKT
jgi:hypothetical protein